MADSSELPVDHPMRVAFREYQNTDEYENNRKWAQYSQSVDGSLWSVFIAGMEAQKKLQSTTPADAAQFRERLIALCQQWTPANLDRCGTPEEIIREVAEGPHRVEQADAALAEKAAAFDTLCERARANGFHGPNGVFDAAIRAQSGAVHKDAALLSFDDVVDVTQHYRHDGHGVVVPLVMVAFKEGHHEVNATWKARDEFAAALNALLAASKGGAS